MIDQFQASSDTCPGAETNRRGALRGACREVSSTGAVVVGRIPHGHGQRSTGHMVARQASDTEALARPLFVRLAVWRGWLKGKSEGLLHARRESTTVRTCSLFWSRSRQACCSAVVHGWQRHWRCRLRVAFPARSRPDITAQEDRIRSIHRLEVHIQVGRTPYVSTVRTEDGTVGPYLFVVG